MRDFWTKERTEVLVSLWANKRTMLQIGRLLGVSRNAVAGKINRMGLRPKPKPEKKVKRQRVIFMTKRKIVKLAPPKEAPHGKEVPLLKRKDSQCAYLVGHHICCGAPVLKRANKMGKIMRTAWCPFHYNIVYQRVRDRAA